MSNNTINDLFINKYRKRIVQENKFAYDLFKSAYNKAKTNNNKRKVLNKAIKYKSNLHGIFFILQNQGHGYGKPINSPSYSKTPKVTRNYFERNVRNFKSTGNLNANLAKLNSLIKRYKNIMNKTTGFNGMH